MPRRGLACLAASLDAVAEGARAPREGSAGHQGPHGLLLEAGFHYDGKGQPWQGPEQSDMI